MSTFLTSPFGDGTPQRTQFAANSFNESLVVQLIFRNQSHFPIGINIVPIVPHGCAVILHNSPRYPRCAAELQVFSVGARCPGPSQAGVVLVRERGCDDNIRALKAGRVGVGQVVAQHSMALGSCTLGLLQLVHCLKHEAPPIRLITYPVLSCSFRCNPRNSFLSYRIRGVFRWLAGS
jgi:hypothetical protein